MLVETAEQQVLLLGAACLDIKGRSRLPLRQHTSNAGEIRLTAGGAARNIAETLARLNVPCRLISVVGDDAYGSQILDETTAAGVDTSSVIVKAGASTALYLAVLDDEGHLSVSVDDVEILSHLNPPYIYSQRASFSEASLVAVDANLAPNSLGTAITLAKRAGVPVCLSTVSTFLATRARRWAKHCNIVIGNLAEIGALCDCQLEGASEASRAAHCLVTAGTEVAVVTMGAEGVAYATAEGKGFIPAIQCEVVDPSGAGDALTAAVIYGYINQFPIDDALRLGVSAATRTLSCRDTVCRDLNQETLYQRMVI